MLSESKVNLAKSYDVDALRRSQQTALPNWKIEERARFLHRLHQEEKKNLLEIGSGIGRDSKFFSDEGLEITCIDLSQEMIRFCKAQGLEAHVMDFYNLAFPDASFDAVYALNCLLHVPKNELAQVLLEIKRVLKNEGLFFMGVYGGTDEESIWENDWCEPKRLFSFFTDEAIKALVGQYFELVHFHTVPLEPGKPYFQSIVLRKRD